MSNEDATRIIIRHVAGSKVNQIEQIPLDNLTDITIGRDPSSNVAFDSKRDDVVSRRHAVIRVIRGDELSFRLADLGSSNGTFLNGERITEEKELLPEDTVGLGKDGLKFVFDVQPRPANMVARTRVMTISDAASTRILKTAEIAASTATQDVSTKSITAESTAPKFEPPPPKPGLGKETVLRLLSEERQATSRTWTSVAAGFAAIAILGGGAFYWKHRSDLSEVTKQQADLVAKLDQDRVDIEQKTSDQFGSSAQDIVKRYGNTTAQIDRAWRLYDQSTGKPVFHQTVSVLVDKKRRERETYPAYVRLPGNLGIVRWLTLEDDNRTNIEIGGRGSGTGFVVSEQGFMLTNKHVAAAWNLPFGEHDRANSYRYGWLWDFGGGPGARDPKLRAPTRIDLGDSDYRFLKYWVPASGGFVFLKDLASFPRGVEGNVPDPSKGGTHTFFGRNDVLEVRFANSSISANANLVRTSNDSDAALIKVDTPQVLNKVDIASDDMVSVGEPVMALGYPAVAADTVVKSTTRENGVSRENEEYLPLPFVSEGIVALVSPHARTENGVTLEGRMGDIIQMSINSTGAGNSGGPVFNKSGKVIGLFTYGISLGGANTSGAVPIKYGRDLLLAQHP
ncbi:MAG TPA: trypsin-like peptidase domain-containing protein [Methylocella sp.]|nr:trypsin-like peptidase domain-containing protein [Methylocella sp.]